MTTPDHYAVKGAARVLGLSESTVRRLVRTGDLVATRVGRNRRTVRIAARTLAEYLAQGRAVARG